MLSQPDSDTRPRQSAPKGNQPLRNGGTPRSNLQEPLILPSPLPESLLTALKTHLKDLLPLEGDSVPSTEANYLHE